MFEFDTVSSSSPADLARSLTQRSADGWEVVSIVGSGMDITAFVRRSRSAASTTAAAGSFAAGTRVSNDEPAGWGTSPSSSADNGWAASSSTESTTGYTAAAASVPASSTANTTSQVPAGWYADPAGRYELRYWDGAQWTEHVARGGTQYKDAPVA